MRIPGEDAIDVAIYAGNLTTGQILAGLAAAADIEEINPDPAALGSSLTRLLTGLRGRDRPLVAMIDALDESTDPQHLAEQLLRPLIDRVEASSGCFSAPVAKCVIIWAGAGGSGATSLT